MIKIYNTLSAKVEDFKPINENKIGMYVCGPTVYDRAHLGHGRSMVVFDFIRRYFEYSGFTVNFVSNYTDIDDKMIDRAKLEGISVKQLSDKIIPLYEEDFSMLNIKEPTSRPLATEYIPQMMVLVKDLLAQGFAYEIADDGIYFEVEKFPMYGKLSKQKLEELQFGSRVDVIDGKKAPADFVLWKYKKEGEPSWTDEGGVLKEGRPGWHIECSAMSKAILGESFDIHGGGQDLIFPHHECEIAQSESCNHVQFANYWIHNGYINVDGEKMSKSLCNFKTLNDIFKTYSGNIVRYALIATHYRSPIEFTEAMLEQSKVSLQRLQNFYSRVVSAKVVSSEVNLEKDFQEKLFIDFQKFLDNDFDIAGALGILFSFVTKCNSVLDSNGINVAERDGILYFLHKINSFLQVLKLENETLDQYVLDMIKERELARKNKDFKRSDEIRFLLQGMGIELLDSSTGTEWRFS